MFFRCVTEIVVAISAIIALITIVVLVVAVIGVVSRYIYPVQTIVPDGGIHEPFYPPEEH